VRCLRIVASIHCVRGPLSFVAELVTPPTVRSGVAKAPHAEQPGGLQALRPIATIAANGKMARGRSGHRPFRELKRFGG
jgi:hypothetical protein